MSPCSKARTCPRTPKFCIAGKFRFMQSLQAMNWPHGPTHWLFEPGLYMITTGTYQKLPHLNSTRRLDFFLESLFACAIEFGWDLRAWAVLANHYHVIAASPSNPGMLPKFLGKL